MTDVAESKKTTIHDASELEQKLERARSGGSDKARAKLREQNKLMARERIDRLFDEGATFVEDGLLANNLAGDLPADGVVTGIGTLGGRTCAVMANDPSVKAGSWGARTVEKIVRILETAERLQIPMVYLVDSAGARITDQVAMFPGVATPGASSACRCACPGRCRSSACSSGPPPPAAPTSPRSATR